MNWKFVKEVVVREDVQLLCIQETMRETISKEICQALWLDQEVEWVISSTVNKVGGLLCLWSYEYF